MDILPPFLTEVSHTLELRQINEIDTRVFDLYGLTPEEREIVLKN